MWHFATRKPSARALNGRVWRLRGQRKQDSQSQKSKSRIDHILQCERHRPLWVLATGPNDQSASLQRDPVAFALLRDKSCGKPNSVCFTTTMHLLTMPWAYGSSWLRRTFSCSTCWSNLPIHLTLLRVTFYFPKLKGVIKGTRFDNVETIKRSVTTEIRGILEESFQQCIEAWPTRMEKCIRLKGNYFEGETM